MTGNDKTETRKRRTGWIWVWGALVIYFVFEAARLA